MVVGNLSILMKKTGEDGFANEITCIFLNLKIPKSGFGSIQGTINFKKQNGCFLSFKNFISKFGEGIIFFLFTLSWQWKIYSGTLYQVVESKNLIPIESLEFGNCPHFNEKGK